MTDVTDQRAGRLRAGSGGRCARSIRPALVAAAASLLLAACGGGDDAPQRGGGGGDSAAGVELEDRLGFGTAGIMTRQNRVEALIQTCMKQNGFEYVPIDPQAGQGIVSRAARLGDKDFIDQFGYGISTVWGLGSPADEDPNQRLRAALGPADRRAYDRTLYGDRPGATFADAVDSGDLTRIGGCTREAAQAAFGDGRVIQQIVARFDALDERITADRRMVRAEQQWVACMAAAGHRYESADEIEEDLTRRMEQIVGPISGPLATGPPPGEPAQPVDRAQLTALQREEVAVARADFACEEKEIAPVEAVVRPQYEERFSERNSALIRSVRAVW